MFRPDAKRRPSRMRSGLELLEIVYLTTVWQLRGSHSSAVKGLVMSVIQAALVLAIFVFMFDLLGMRRVKIPGADFVLYVMSGVFLFMTHIKALGAVSGAMAPTSSMMMHAPMNPLVAVVSAALGALYSQTFSAGVILFLYHAIVRPVYIADPVGLLGMYMLAWGSGAAIGTLFYAAKPWSPDLVGILAMIYQRANMVASGKMLVANMTPPKLRAWFDWNPLFHAIDQARGSMFLNYTPHHTSVEYPIKVALVCLMIGLIGQFFTSKYASASWGKRR